MLAGKHNFIAIFFGFFKNCNKKQKLKIKTIAKSQVKDKLTKVKNLLLVSRQLR
jgi:hypothetical protein